MSCKSAQHVKSYGSVVLTVTQLGAPRRPVCQGRLVLQMDPAEDVPWSVGQTGEHPRCSRARYSNAGSVYAELQKARSLLSLSCPLVNTTQFRQINATTPPLKSGVFHQAVTLAWLQAIKIHTTAPTVKIMTWLINVCFCKSANVKTLLQHLRPQPATFVPWR